MRYKGGNQAVREDIADFMAARPGFGETVAQQQKRQAREAKAREKKAPEPAEEPASPEWAESMQAAREHYSNASMAEAMKGARSGPTPHAVRAAIERRDYMRGNLPEEDYAARLSGQEPPAEQEEPAAPEPASYMDLKEELRGTKNRIKGPPPPGASVPLEAAEGPAAKSAGRSTAGKSGPSIDSPPIASQVPPPPPVSGVGVGVGALGGAVAGIEGGVGAGIGTGAVAGFMAGGPWGAAIGAGAGLLGGLVNAAKPPQGSIADYQIGGGSERSHDGGGVHMQGLLSALNKIAGIRSRL